MAHTYYLSGPMKGYPESNFPLFERATAALRAQGYLIVSPHEKGSETPDANYYDLLRADGRLIMDCHGIILLPGWPTSKGACWELNIALGLGLEVWFYAQDARGLVKMSAVAPLE